MERDDVIAELEQRVARYGAARYPVQRATAQFHLGVVQADCGLTDEAVPSLEEAERLFAEAGLEEERAKAGNALGVALRLAGDLGRAERVFSEAAAAFERLSLEREQGAALFNLGLAARERDPRLAEKAFARARTLLPARESAAATREHGATLLALGEDATGTLQRAAELAEEVGDEAGRGGALNALGLARLGAGEVDAAVEAFRAAVAAHPRSIRPQEYAMAKANLALAYEQQGDAPRARLAARQARDAPLPPAPVTEQAERTLARLGPGRHDLADVLDAGSAEAILREEVVRWAELPPDEARGEAATWIETQLARPELAQTWLGALLELPPDAMEAVIRSVIAELPEDSRFRAETERSMAAFYTPQLLRLQAAFGWS